MHSEKNNLQKEAIGALGLAGIGAGMGLLAYGLEKSYGLLTGNKDISEVISGLNVDKQKVENFKSDLAQIKEMAPDLIRVNATLAETLPAYIKACEQMLPQMEQQISAAEKAVADKKKSVSTPGQPAETPEGKQDEDAKPFIPKLPPDID